jgi:3',5'-cyclic AMP phosphodiesterase CpdA
MLIAHISDLHFFQFDWNPIQFFSKRWLGQLNFILSRRKRLGRIPLSTLVEAFRRHHVSKVIITGDFTTTGSRQELQLAAAFVQLLQEEGIEVFSLPGNHDHYTRRGFRSRLFYRFFPSSFGIGDRYRLCEDRLTLHPLSDRWSLILLDCATATWWSSSRGFFSEKQESLLHELLASVPPTTSLIMANHFPFFDTDPKDKRLSRGRELRALLEQYPSIRLYLHGHTHRQILADLRGSHLPLILDSGSSSDCLHGGWHLIDLSGTQVRVTPFRWKGGAWQPHPVESDLD